MNRIPWKSWHEIVRLREDLKSGELSLSLFAADLYDVVMNKGPAVYRNPRDFFALTYPTFNLRELAKNVVLRLASKNDKAVQQLELTYGGGKTHALIALYHLVHKPDELPSLPSVREFLGHIGKTPPKAAIAVLPFDKLDVEKGVEVIGPKGEKRWLKNPWSVLAFQIAGSDGLRLLHAQGRDEERESAPAENLLTELLLLPYRDGLGVLILIDEVLMYAREKVGLDPAWRHKLVDFFQYLTQAATKMPACAIVASLLATDPRKSDTLGKELAQELYAVFRREREEGVQPVVKEDVAEILRRRFFTPESIKDRGAFRPHVVATLRGIAELDDATKREGKDSEDRFLASYPFHPDLTEVLYSKWTQLEGFQRTRGVLRTFALALRDSEKWDESPLVGCNVFLRPPSEGDVSEAARELTTVAATEEYEGKKQEWTSILSSELEKAREVQGEFASLKLREIEQAVFATFLHSQPIGQRAQTHDLMVLLGASRPDSIDLHKALLRWAEVSWFLDDTALVEAGSGSIPPTWRLGSKPNLTQMHKDALRRIPTELVETKLANEIGRLKSLTQAASAAGAIVHNLPEKSRDVEDDGQFHYVVLGPKAASDSGKPSIEAKRFVEETTSPDRPRIRSRNSIVLAVPSHDGLEISRNKIKEYLAWEEVRTLLEDKDVDSLRRELLLASIEKAKKSIPDAVRQAYCIVVTTSEQGDTQAFRIAVSEEPLFNIIKADPRCRIQEAPVSAEALLPGGPYELWKKGETSRRVKDLVEAFAQFSNLPKMLRRKEILDTLVQGMREGAFVILLTRPDHSSRTYWREDIAEEELKDPSLEAVLSEAATIVSLSPALLSPNMLPDLWKSPDTHASEIFDYFSGGRTATVNKNGYTEKVTIPKASRETVMEAIHQAVLRSILWLTSGPTSVLGEEIPDGILTPQARLQAPPPPISATAILPHQLAEAWTNSTTTGLAIYESLSKRAGKNLPWRNVQQGISEAQRARLLEVTADSGLWPCDYSGATAARFRLTAEQPPPPPSGEMVSPEVTLQPHEIQDLVELLPDIRKSSAGLNMSFHMHVELHAKPKPSSEVMDRINGLLKRVKKDLELR